MDLIPKNASSEHHIFAIYRQHTVLDTSNLIRGQMGRRPDPLFRNGSKTAKTVPGAVKVTS
jgi:hypothetical protein